MFDQNKMKIRRRLRLLAFPLMILALSGFTQTGLLFGFSPAASAVEEDSGSDTLNKLKIASMQHDLILLLIESNDFDRVKPEWEKVLDLGLSENYESAIAQSLLMICYKLTEANQLSLAQTLMDESLPEYL